MKSRQSFTTSAIVLKRSNYSEADRILTLLTPAHGKISVMAKGVRRMESKRKGHIELFNHVQASMITGYSMAILTEVQVIEQFNLETLNNTFTDAWSRLSSAFHLAEITERLTPEEHESSDIFELLARSFRYLHTDCPDYEQLHRSFKLKMLQTLGYWPDDRSMPQDIDGYLETILEKPLKTKDIFFLS